ncbi:hypothetical protein [Arachidicoccus ginsenosidivorans]|nr:hypothetical protein [Arachidicoccus ginsenosidivorans]
MTINKEEATAIAPSRSKVNVQTSTLYCIRYLFNPNSTKVWNIILYPKN